MHAGKRRDQVAAGLGLPPGVDDRAAPVADGVVVPHPRLGVDRLADRAEDAQRFQIVFLRKVSPRLDKRANGSGSSVEHRHLVVLDHFPEAPRVRPHRHAFEHHFGRADRERAVGAVAVPGHPADVRGAPEHVRGLVVEDPLHGDDRHQQVAAGRVLHALRLAGRARCIQDEERVFGVHPGRLAGFGLAPDHVVPPLVARGLKGDRSPGAFVHDHVLHAFAAAQSEGLVHRGLERDFLAAAHLPVGGDHRDRPRVDNALLQTLRRESAEHHRVRRADPRAGLHRRDDLDRHRHVDDDALALPDAERFERVRELADLVVELLVGELRDLAVVRLENDGCLVALRLQVPVEAVVRRVQLAVAEPLEEGRVRLIEHLGERLVPEHVLLG